jgi:hypothetical protein
MVVQDGERRNAGRIVGGVVARVFLFVPGPRLSIGKEVKHARGTLTVISPAIVGSLVHLVEVYRKLLRRIHPCAQHKTVARILPAAQMRVRPAVPLDLLECRSLPVGLVTLVLVRGGAACIGPQQMLRHQRIIVPQIVREHRNVLRHDNPRS